MPRLFMELGKKIKVSWPTGHRGLESTFFTSGEEARFVKMREQDLKALANIKIRRLVKRLIEIGITELPKSLSFVMLARDDHPTATFINR
jgi:hypothetical protein